MAAVLRRILKVRAVRLERVQLGVGFDGGRQRGRGRRIGIVRVGHRRLGAAAAALDPIDGHGRLAAFHERRLGGQLALEPAAQIVDHGPNRRRLTLQKRPGLSVQFDVHFTARRCLLHSAGSSRPFHAGQLLQAVV